MKLPTERVFDQYDRSWVVKSGDPARKAVLALRAKGFTYIVLTRERLRGMMEGQLPEPTSPALARLHDCARVLEEVGLGGH